MNNQINVKNSNLNVNKLNNSSDKNYKTQLELSSGSSDDGVSQIYLTISDDINTHQMRTELAKPIILNNVPSLTKENEVSEWVNSLNSINHSVNAISTVQPNLLAENSQNLLNPNKNEFYLNGKQSSIITMYVLLLKIIITATFTN